MQIPEVEQKIRKKFFVFQIPAFELGVAISGNIEQDTFHRRSMCQETPLRFQLTLGEKISKLTFPKMMKKYAKTAPREISLLFGTLSHVRSLSVFRNDASYKVVWRSFSQSVISQKTLAMTIIFFFKMFKTLRSFQTWNKKLRKSFSVFRKYHLNWELQCLAILKRIIAIGSQCVKKHPSDFTLNYESNFSDQLPSEWWKNLIKVLSCRFCKYSGHFDMSTVSTCTETALLTEWRDELFHSI